LLTYHHHLHLQRQDRRIAARIDRLAGGRYDCVVAVAEAGKRFLISEYGYRPDRVTCIRNGWSGTPIADPPKPDVPTIVCVANFRAQKRHDVLLDAFAQLVGRIPDARLLLVGDGPLAGEARECARRRGVAERVEFLGSVHSVWPVLARAHVFALSSDYEGLPVALVEAMAAGLPAVASDVDGNTDLVHPGRTGLLFPPGNAAACADRLVTMLSDDRSRDRMGRAARELAQEWRMDRCVARYFELYRRLIRGTGNVQAPEAPR
jgi:glycosyltransferase involved in cell wall biosynthesis